MNIARALACPGFMSEAELSYLARIAGKSRRIIEVGSWKGRSTIAFAENTSGIVWAVDSWDGRLQHDTEAPINRQVFNEFLHNTEGLTNIWPVPMESTAAAKLMREAGMLADVVFIDGTHSYEAVKADILAWRPLLACYGIFCGHDFADPNWSGVEKAVRELIPKFSVIDHIWTTEAL